MTEMGLKFNINISNNNLVNIFIKELQEIKKIMEAENTNFYLNIQFGADEIETLDLSRVATIEIVDDGIAYYSLATRSSCFIFFNTIVGFEFVEQKIVKIRS